MNTNEKFSLIKIVRKRSEKSEYSKQYLTLNADTDKWEREAFHAPLDEAVDEELKNKETYEEYRQEIIEACEIDPEYAYIVDEYELVKIIKMAECSKLPLDIILESGLKTTRKPGRKKYNPDNSLASADKKEREKKELENLKKFALVWNELLLENSFSHPMIFIRNGFKYKNTFTRVENLSGENVHGTYTWYAAAAQFHELKEI